MPAVTQLGSLEKAFANARMLACDLRSASR